MSNKETVKRAFKHPHDRALIAFASCVLETMQSHEDWSADTTAEIADAAHNFGLADAYDNGQFTMTPRADFENPLNL